MRTGAGRLVLGLGYVWLTLWAVSVVGACTMNGLKAGDALGFIGRTQEFFSPFNLANWILIVLVAAPGMGLATLGGKLLERPTS